MEHVKEKGWFKDKETTKISLPAIVVTAATFIGAVVAGVATSSAGQNGSNQKS